MGNTLATHGNMILEPLARSLSTPKKSSKNGMFLGLFVEPLFSFLLEKASQKRSRNGVPFSDRGPSSSIVNSCKISLFASLDGGPFLGPRPRPLKIRRGSIFDVFWGPKKCETGVYFLGFFLGHSNFVQNVAIYQFAEI